MPQKCQTILLGIGDLGQKVVRQYAAEYGCTKESEDRNRAKVIALSHGERPPPAGAACRPVLYSRTRDELLDRLAEAFASMLGDRPVRDFGHTYYLDVFVCGAWRDEEFRRLLPLVLPFVERLAHERYASVFNPGEDTRNARLLLHPVALSVNMPRESSRSQIARLLANIDQWHTGLAGIGRAVIPRFFIYDGFTNNIQLNDAEIVGITANFVGLCTRGGVRADRDFRQLLNFSSYGEDFFCVMNLATIYFPREHFQQRALDLIVGEFHALLTAKPDLRVSVGADLQEGPTGLDPLVRDDILGSPLLRHGVGADDYRKSILERMLRYRQTIDANSPALEDGLTRIFAQGDTFPADPQAYPPETLERFFDRRWLHHLLDSCYPPPGRDVAAAYTERATRLRRLWNRDLKRIMDRLEHELGDLLGAGQCNFSLNSFSAALHRAHDASVLPARRSLMEAAVRLPQRRWRFTATRDIWARLRSQIWNYIPLHAIKYWLPFLAALSALPLLAAFRFGLTFLDSDTEGARLLHRLDAHPFLLPALMLASLGISLPILGVVYLFKRRRLKRYLDTTPSDLPEDYAAVTDDDAPELVGRGDFDGLLPSVGSVMARKTGMWWYKQEALGALGLVQGMLRLVSLRVTRLRETAETVLRLVDEQKAAAARMETARLTHNLYFSDYLLNPDLADAFGNQVNNSLSCRISAQNIAQRLHRDGLDAFLLRVADAERVRAEAAMEVPFFEHGNIFALPDFERHVAVSLRIFLCGLADRLSHGQIFHFLASQEQDKLIEDTQILLVCPAEALGLLQHLERENRFGYKTILSRDRDHIWGLRIIRDVSIQSVLRYMHPELSAAEIERNLAAWLGVQAEATLPPRPWSELQVDP